MRSLGHGHQEPRQRCGFATTPQQELYIGIKSPRSTATAQALPSKSRRNKFFRCGGDVIRTSTSRALATPMVRRHSPARAAKPDSSCAAVRSLDIDINSMGNAAALHALPSKIRKTEFFRCGSEIIRTSTSRALATLLLRRRSPAIGPKLHSFCAAVTALGHQHQEPLQHCSFTTTPQQEPQKQILKELSS